MSPGKCEGNVSEFFAKKTCKESPKKILELSLINLEWVLGISRWTFTMIYEKSTGFVLKLFLGFS